MNGNAKFDRYVACWILFTFAAIVGFIMLINVACGSWTVSIPTAVCFGICFACYNEICKIGKED